MEFIDVLPCPEMGTWLSEEFDQDFCYGAKASTSLNPALATPSGSWTPDDLNNTSEWSEQNNNLNEFLHLESFPDVILHDRSYFSPKDLFGELKVEMSPEEFYEASPEGLAASPIFELSHSPPESPQNQKLPTVKIKLKRIKRPKALKHDGKMLNKKNIKSDFEFEIVKPKVTSIEYTKDESPPTPELFFQNDSPYMNGSSGVEKDISRIDEHFSLDFTSAPEFSPEDSTIPGLSLHDAFDTGDADNFLDELLNDTIMGEDIPSPLSSINSFLPSPNFDYSDVEMSPSTLETIDRSVLSPTEEMLEFSEVTTLQRGEDSKVKKRHQKLSNESRYLRKKEQNKQAALRYRMKKKQEDGSISKALKREEECREKLKMEVSNLKQEIHIMKTLLREAFIVKKLVPENFFKK